MRDHPTIKAYVGDRPVRITLHVRTTETPADVRDLGDEGVQINLASYYFEKYDIGYIMGMLAHEIGLHPLATRNPDIPDEEAMFRGIPLPVPGLGDLKTPRTMNTDSAGQADHIMAAFPSSTRHGIYRDIVLKMADMLAEAAQAGVEGAKAKDATDLIDTYLMDLASIAITSDYRMNAAKEPGNTAKVYNAYKAQFAARMAEDSPARGLLPADKGMFGCRTGLRDTGRESRHQQPRRQHPAAHPRGRRPPQASADQRRRRAGRGGHRANPGRHTAVGGAARQSASLRGAVRLRRPAALIPGGADHGPHRPHHDARHGRAGGARLRATLRRCARVPQRPRSPAAERRPAARDRRTG
ncbi:hypothetical protein ACRJ4W_10425 [Streptomyces sp. GLT-R25]